MGGREKQLGIAPPPTASSPVEALKVAAVDAKDSVDDVVKKAEEAIRK